MNRDKIESEIKELNSFRARYKRDFNEIEKRFHKTEISEKNFQKQKQKYNSKVEKIKLKIRKLEEELVKQI
jgi:hypothetical protein